MSIASEDPKPAFKMNDFKAFFPEGCSSDFENAKTVWHSKHMNSASGLERNVKATISSYLVVNIVGKNALHRYAKPSAELVEWIKKNMIHVKYDTIHFEIVMGKGFCTLRACYNQIIGSTLLAELTKASVLRAVPLG